MNDLADFLCARLDMEEAVAKAATPGPWQDTPGSEITAGERMIAEVYLPGGEDYDEQCADAAHIALHGPVRARLALALKAAASLDRLRRADSTASAAEMAVAVACAAIAITAVKHDAAAWSDHPDYRPEWAAAG